MQRESDYNRTSCRACGNRLLVAKTCSHCGEPVVWYCESCFMIYDSLHAHPAPQNKATSRIAATN